VSERFDSCINFLDMLERAMNQLFAESVVLTRLLLIFEKHAEILRQILRRI